MNKSWEGTVVRKNSNTAYVEIKVTKLHRYGRYIQISSVFPADDRLGAKIGDKVLIEECKKISKTKSKKIVSIGGVK
jgi:ribosomal protein S17